MPAGQEDLALDPVNNKDRGLERMTLEGLVRTLQILVERHGRKTTPPLEANQADLEDAIAGLRRKKKGKK